MKKEEKVHHVYHPDCFIPEEDDGYPLCIGRGLEKCEDCQLRADYEADDQYGYPSLGYYD